MKNKYLLSIFCLFFVLFLISCNRNNSIVLIEENQEDASSLKIAFGSCSDETLEQKLWDDVISEEADYWVWLGDNIYGDTEDMTIMREKFNRQKSHPLYQKLKANSTITGTWDDHDYGANDAGKEYPKRKEAQKEFLDFLDVPEDDPRRKREGVYTSLDIDYDGIQIKLLILDVRYFRDDLYEVDGVCMPNLDGTILGKEQWAWLENEIRDSKADLFVVATGIQVIPEEHRFEKWSNFPVERLKLFDLFYQNEAKRVVFISGDRHIGEISSMDYREEIYYDLTSSSLTHGWSERIPEKNSYRIGEIVYDINYGVLEIRNSNKLEITGYLKSDGAKIIESSLLSF